MNRDSCKHAHRQGSPSCHRASQGMVPASVWDWPEMRALVNEAQVRDERTELHPLAGAALGLASARPQQRGEPHHRQHPSDRARGIGGDRILRRRCSGWRPDATQTAHSPIRFLPISLSSWPLLRS
eukprot:s1678_g15.t1